MVQLTILSGRMAGTSWVTRRFPVQIGRAPGADFRSDEDGVWEDHIRITFSPAEGFRLHARSEALVCVNAEPVREADLRNGDLIELGALKLQFWLEEVRPHSSRWQEAFIWAGLAAVSVAQIAIIWWLPR